MRHAVNDEEFFGHIFWGNEVSQVKNIGLKTSGLGLKTLGLGLKHPIFFSPEPQALSPIFWGNEVSQVKNIGLKTS
ncbi:MAG TPA: hypothetical protein PLB32_03175, partial [Acidobacteriota bacterium]|nr:hypothetical protein [Acidobacteriota bacterium]